MSAPTTSVGVTTSNVPSVITPQNFWEAQSLIEKLRKEKRSGNETQLRKHPDWNDNYDLYRLRVKTNRLTQRQAVMIPLMKETIKTLLSKIDEAPQVKWRELDDDQDREILYQELWEMVARDNKFELVDIVDKKNVLLYGIGTTKLNLCPGGVDLTALDPFDVVFDPLMSPGQVETARFIVHQNIFKSLRDILANDTYDKAAQEELKMWIDSPAGVTQGTKNKEEYDRRMQRMRDMGTKQSDFALFAGGDRVINITEHFTKMWNEKTEKWERRVITYADETVVLRNVSIMEALGVEFWPFVVWVEDPETTDLYSDSVADLVRVPNKVVNVWVSQMIENRTLKNFQMHWFSPVQGYQPQTYTPGPGVMLPAPPGDDIRKVIMPVEVSGLEDTIDSINWLIQIAERGSGATAIEKGEPESGEQTLGEIRILVGKASERTVSMRKFYRMAWTERAQKWDALMHANPPKLSKLYKTGPSGKMYSKTLYKSDWMSEAGYQPIVESTSEQEENEVKNLQKWQFVLKSHPNNLALQRIGLKRELELLDLSAEELKEVEEAEEQAAIRAATTPIAPDAGGMPGAPMPGAPGGNAPAPVAPGGIISPTV